MSEQQKKTIPKFKKKLQGFLSDESGKITKEDVLKMGMVAMGVWGMVWGIDQVNAGWNHTSNYAGVPANSHTNGNGWTCYWQWPWAFWDTVNGHASGSGVAWGNCFGGTGTHGNATHGSHNNHSSHCNCGRWG